MKTFMLLAGSMMNLLLVENQGAQEFRMKGGSQKIAQKLVTKIGPHRVLLNHEAIEIDQTGDRPKVLFQNGVAVSCKKVIITLPPNCIANLRFEPPLKHSKVKLKFLKRIVLTIYIHHLFSQDFVICGVFLQKSFISTLRKVFLNEVYY